jgi:cobalt-zinc-cadmium efflux system membrane fusion protein
MLPIPFRKANTVAFLLLNIAITFLSCGPKKVEEKNVAFSMSDTMMALCEFYTATEQPLKDELRLFGKISTDNNKTAQVYSVLSGVVKSINIGLGDYVKQGQVLAVLQSSEVAGFQQELLDAQNDLAIAEKDLQVQKDLSEGKLNSEKDLAAANVERQKARARLSKIKDIFNIYKLQGGSNFQIVAPISGFVITKNININELLRSDAAEPLFSIADMNVLWAVANVNETDISKIRENEAVSVNTLAFPDQTYKGTIEKIYNVIDDNTKAMKIRVRIPNPDIKLKPEMNCTVSVHLQEAGSKIAVPSNAIIFDKNKYWVMVFKDKHNIETRPVEVYRQLNDTSYITSGLNAGEKIISKNGLLVYDALND